jgi:hypothetical protein
MSGAFLIFAIVLNAGVAVLVFWWVFRELRRNSGKDQHGTNQRGTNQRGTNQRRKD